MSSYPRSIEDRRIPGANEDDDRCSKIKPDQGRRSAPADTSSHAAAEILHANETRRTGDSAITARTMRFRIRFQRLARKIHEELAGADQAVEIV